MVFNGELCRQIVRQALSLTENERVSYLTQVQKQCNKTPTEFYNNLNSWFDQEKHFWKNYRPGGEMFAGTVDGKETWKPKEPDYLTFDEMEAIQPTLDQYKKENENDIWLDSKNTKYRYSFDFGEIPEPLKRKVISYFFTINGKQYSASSLASWKDDYRNFLDTRPAFRELFLSKGIEYAEIALRHFEKYEPKDFNKIDGLHLRIDAARSLFYKEPDLEPIEGSLNNASHYVVLLHELGIIDHLKEKYPYLSAQRLGELCEFITGQKTPYFRETISNQDPTKWRAFTEKSQREVASQLKQFGID